MTLSNQILTCAICGRNGKFVITDEPIKGRKRILCQSESRIHAVVKGQHILIRTTPNDQEPELNFTKILEYEAMV